MLLQPSFPSHMPFSGMYVHEALSRCESADTSPCISIYPPLFST